MAPDSTKLPARQVGEFAHRMKPPGSEYPSTRPETHMHIADDELAAMLGLTADQLAGLPEFLIAFARELLAS